MLKAEVIGIQIIFKVMQLSGVTKGARKVEKEKKRPKTEILSSEILRGKETRRNQQKGVDKQH